MRPPRCAPRSDARANRARIVEAGRSVFDGDRSAGLQAVAKAAGVGQGTLYRHFPDREALLLAVYEEELAGLAADAAHLLSGHGPLEALRLWFERLAAHAHGTHGASLAVDAATRPGRHHPPLLAALELLLDAGKAARQVRPDAGADEVMLLGSCLWRDDGGPACPERGRRVLTVVIDGLRAGTDG